MSQEALSVPQSLPSIPNKVEPTAYQWQATVRPVLLLSLLVVLGALFLLSLSLGSVDISVDNVARILLGGEGERVTHSTIIWKYRFPKSVTAVLAGAALAVSGLQMQTFFRNPLAGPFVLGISSGASLGVAVLVLSAGTSVVSRSLLSSMISTTDASLIAAASLGAGIVMFLVLLVSRAVQNTTTLLIVGLMFGYLTSALVSLLMYFSIAEQIQAYVNWTFGSFTGLSQSQLKIFAPIILGSILLAIAQSKALNALLLGEHYARSMGLHLQQTRIWIILSTAALAGTVTAFCGPIGFLGIAVPHLSRAIFRTADHRTLMPATALLGSIVALIAAIIADMPGTALVLPLNAVTALIGAPVVVWVIVRRHRHNVVFTG